MMATQDHTSTSDILAHGQRSKDNSTGNIGTNAGRQRLHKGRDTLTPVQEVTEDLDYNIDTSVMERVLPPFSSGEDEDADDDMSIEVARGAKPFIKNEDSRDSIMSIEDSQVVLSPSMKLRFPDSAQKAAKARKPSASSRDRLRKESSIRRASLAVKDKDQEPEPIETSKSKTPRAANKAQRRSLADVHNRISEAYDGSYLSDERPPTFDVATKNTRFSKAHMQDQTDEIKRAIEKVAGRINVNQENNSRNRQLNNHTNTITDNQTHQSFALPDLENLSELVSGILQDGVRKQPLKTRTTRFTSPTEREGQHYAALNAVPIPNDEKIIFSALKHLQEKIASLEADKNKLAALEQENMRLKFEKAQQVEEDGGRAAYASSDDNTHSHRPAKTAIEKHRLEAANIALQQHLENANQRISLLENTLKKENQEKESALTERGAVYFASRELKLQNEELAKENEDLRARVSMLTELLKLGGAVDRAGQHASGRKDDSVPRGKAGDATESQEKSVVYDETTTSNQARPRSAQRPKDGKPKQAKRKPSLSLPAQNEEYAELFSLDIPVRQQSLRLEKTKPRSKDELKAKQPTVRRRQSKKDLSKGDDDVSYTKHSEHGNAEKTRTYRRIDEPQKDLTFLSFMDAQEIARLRKTLEEERVAQKNKLLQGEPTLTNVQREPTMTGQLRPALKRSKSDITRPGVLDQTGEQAAQGGNPTGQVNAQGDFAGPKGEQDPAKEPTCNGAASDDTQRIPKPVPVSERQPVQQIADNAEPTQRPAQPPAVALATVLKVLEDEVNHLKSQLESNQKALKNHDASLGKKQRKVLVKNIESLLHEIDTKSDQIYSLYDVLEGQKEAGVEMTEDIEDITNAVLGGQNAKGKAKAATNDDDMDAVEIDEAESWGGFEETQELDQPSPRRKDQQRVSL